MPATQSIAANGSLSEHEHPLLRADSTGAELQALRDVLKTGRVTFWPVAHSWFRLNDPELDEETHAAFLELFPKLLDSFADPRGGIVTAYFCRNIRVAAVLTDIDTAASLTWGIPMSAPAEATAVETPTPRGLRARWRAHRTRRAELRQTRSAASASAIHLEPLRGEPADWKAKELLFRCMDLHYRALQYLSPKPCKTCMRMVFGIIVALLGTLDQPPGPRRRPFSSDRRAVESLEAELEQARRYYDRSAQREAQVEYFKGMVFGLGLLLAAAVVAGGVVARPLVEPLIVAPVAGGAGAIVSVMARMTRDQLACNYESGTTTIRLLGVLRPVLGGLFGAALYVLLAGGLITLAQTPTDTTQLIYFYAGIAFIAGFSERWAQDVITGKGATAGDAASVPPASRPNPTPPVSGAR